MLALTSAVMREVFLGVHAKNVDLCYPRRSKEVGCGKSGVPGTPYDRQDAGLCWPRYIDSCFLEDFFLSVLCLQMVVSVQL